MNKEQRPNQFYELVNPANGIAYAANPNRVWAYIPSTMVRLIEEKKILFPSDPSKRPMYKRFKDELRITTDPFSTWMSGVGLNSEGTRRLQELVGGNIAIYAKPVSLLEELISIATDADDLIVDFFAGSGTIADGVFGCNSRDGSRRRFIAVQLPEKLDHPTFDTIAKLARERIRGAGSVLQIQNPLFHGDVGFRVFKLDTTSIRPWDPTLPVTEQRLLGEVDNILPGRTEQDLLYELLLKRGLELTVPLVERTLAGKQVFAVATGDLIACLAPHIASADVEALAEGIVFWHKELAPPPAIDPTAPLGKPAKFDPPLVVFRDTAFADDVAKSNLTEILKQHGLTDVRSL